MSNILDSASALSRFKARNGARVSSSCAASSYILASKMMKMIKKHVNEDNYDNVYKPHFFSKSSQIGFFEFVTRISSKIDSMTNKSILYLWAHYEDKPHELIKFLKISLANIEKKAEIWSLKNGMEED